MTTNIPTSFTPIPWGFIFELTMFFWIFFGLFIIECIVSLSIPCFRKYEKLPQHSFPDVLFLILIVMNIACWLVMIKAYLSILDVKTEILKLADDFLEDVSENVVDRLTQVNTSLYDCYNETIGDAGDILNTFNDIDSQYTDIKSEINNYSSHVDIGFISLITVFSVLLVIFPIGMWVRYKKTTCVVEFIIFFLAFILFFIFVLPGSVVFKFVGDFCGPDVDKTIREVAGDLLNTDNICLDDMGKYLCDYQECSSPTFNPVRDMADELISQIPEGETCGVDVVSLINATFDVLNCDNINGYYNRVVDTIVCSKVKESATYFMIIPGLTGLLLGVVAISYDFII